MTAPSTVRLGQLAEVRPSSVDKLTVAGERPVRLCNYTDIYYGDRLTDSMDFMEATATPDEIRRFGLRRDDVLITKDSETADDIGVAAWVEEDLQNTVLGYHTSLVRPRPGVDGRYLYWALQSGPVRDYFEQEARGVTRVGLRQEDITKTPVPQWPLARQRRVADTLDGETQRLDEIVTRQTDLVRLLEERSKTARLRVLAGSPSVRSRIATGVPWMPWMPDAPGWELTRLKRACVLQRGHDLPAQHRTPGPYPIVSSGGVIDSHSDCRAAGPGVVTGRYGTVGEVYYVDGAFWPLNTALYVVDFRGHDPRYVFHLLSATPLDAESEKSAVGGINRNVVHELPTVLAPRGAQTELADTIDKMQAAHARLVSGLLRQNELLFERRQALITAAVTGQLDIGEAA